LPLRKNGCVLKIFKLFFAVGQESEKVGSANFSIAPRVILHPHAGTVGRTAAVDGYGFGSRETVQVLWANPPTLLGIATTDVDGTFHRDAAVTFTVPSAALHPRRLAGLAGTGISLAAIQKILLPAAAKRDSRADLTLRPSRWCRLQRLLIPAGGPIHAVNQVSVRKRQMENRRPEGLQFSAPNGKPRPSLPGLAIRKKPALWAFLALFVGLLTGLTAFRSPSLPSQIWLCASPIGSQGRMKNRSETPYIVAGLRSA